MADATSKGKPLSKTEMIAAITEKSNLPKQEVTAVLDALTEVIRESLSASGPGVFSLPGLLKIEKKEVPAKPAKTGVPNPFKPGELMDVAAKPASTKVKLVALKSLKDMAQPG